ncbi:uncharacterized protein HRG_01634 [Hirsutella rhossiliensis]|uniref:Uncharacterized protein n=1 Tax=Hirsutella rhossiliensis TaxID=111463 RepID=A0A9P8N3I3_9HYPO|nr:uncharacterized protein HRG_01634 [Hirsutella rhossiliensis]KAH0966225.1 hypothetical protein HRG_01634 [Hirsutella rhossiliensis]
MQNEVDVERTEITSTFIRWFVYCAYFGLPPSIGSIATTEIATGDDVAMTTAEGGQAERAAFSGKPTTTDEEDVSLAIMRHELELERVRLHDTHQRVGNQSLRFEKLAREEVLQKGRLNRISRQVRDQNARLKELRRDSLLEQERLDRLKKLVEQEQGP